MTAPTVVLTITLEPSGQVRVEGPINDKMLCYAMLENARDAVKEFCDAQRASPIVTPTGADILSLRRGNGSPQ